MCIQLDLFPDPLLPSPLSAEALPQGKKLNQKDEISALDEMFAASRRYRSSREYVKPLHFIGRFRKYAPFNCFLLYTQNPEVSYVATAETWRKRFGRRPKPDARPLVILAPMSPVVFVYDLMDTEGKPVPERLLDPVGTQGRLAENVLDNTAHNCTVHGIELHEMVLGHFHGGSAICLTDIARKHFKHILRCPDSRYLIVLKKKHDVEDKYSVLVHELGHIFCGHLGGDPDAWWPNRPGLGKCEVEIEAESVAFLTCRRKGLISQSDKYLSRYIGEDREIPALSINTVLQAVSYIEDMGKSEWEKPRKGRDKREKKEKTSDG